VIAQSNGSGGGIVGSNQNGGTIDSLIFLQ